MRYFLFYTSPWNPVHILYPKHISVLTDQSYFRFNGHRPGVRWERNSLEEEVVHRLLYKKNTLGMGSTIVTKQRPRWEGILLHMRLKGCTCVWKVAFKAPKIYWSHSPRGFSLHPFHTFVSRKGSDPLCFRKRELLRYSFCFPHPAHSFSSFWFISFLKGA